jgi:small ligand-binding sensory domain FIST
VGVTQACRPVTGPLRATRTDGHWILEIDGRPALDVFRETAREPLAHDLRRAASFVLLALPEPGDPEASLAAGDYRVRNVAGFAEGALAVPEPVATGERIAFVLREPHGARDDLKRMLAGLAAGPGGARGDFALYLDCCARGAALFDVPGLESAYLAETLGATPTLGMMGAFEIGPVRGRSELLTYTGVLAVCGEPGSG